MGVTGKLVKATLALAVVGGVVAGAAYFAGVFPPSSTQVEEPTVTVKDIGDWGTVTESRIEVVHTLGVQNPNDAGVALGDATTATIHLQLNGVRLGSVEKQGLDIEPGNNTVEVTSTLRQQRVSAFWARFINEGETIHANVSVTVQVDKGPGYSIRTPPVEVTQLRDQRPLSTALDRMGGEMEGEYTKEVSTDDLDEQYQPDAPVGTTATAGYEVERLDFEWGEVTEDRTELVVNLRVRNVGEIPLPGVPDGVALDILMNDVEVFNTRTEQISLENADRDSVLLPGEAKSYTLVATADNDNVEEWFTTFASRRENSSVRTEFQLYYDLGEETITLPRGGSLAYECQFRTGILVDGQNTSTNCDDGTVKVGPHAVDELTGGGSTPTPTVTSDSTDTPGSTTTATSDGGGAPTASIDANPTEGTAPLEVSFDAGGSTDPDGDIARYVWRLSDGTPLGEGESITHTFATPGEYEVELVAVDAAGNRDSTTVTITVEGV